MKHEVLRDFGVTIAGKTYPHGAVVDSDRLSPRADTVGLPAGMTDEEKVAEVQKRQAALDRQAKSDYDAANASGYFGPVSESAADPKKANKAKGQEG